MERNATTFIPLLSAGQVTEELAYSTGVLACLWSRPLVDYYNTVYEITRAGAACVNYWCRYDGTRQPKEQSDIIPGNVTVDTYGVADLSAGPVIIYVPLLEDNRWYLVQITDRYDDTVYNIGGYRGQEPGFFFLAGSDYEGAVPPDMKSVRVKTKMAVVTLRIFVSNDADRENANGAQKRFHMLPLPVFLQHGLMYKPPGHFPLLPFTFTAPASLRLFEKIGTAMQGCLSVNEDRSNEMIALFHCIGLSVRKGFEWRTLDDGVKQGLNRAIDTAEQIIDETYEKLVVKLNGWRYTLTDGRIGHDFAFRAALAKYILGNNVPEQLFSASCKVDEMDTPLCGIHTYILHFEKHSLPAACSFWNIIVYEDKDFFSGTHLQYSIGSATESLQINEDGSIDIYIQHTAPGEPGNANWLPAPKGKFSLAIRFYGGKSSILAGACHLPSVKKYPEIP